MSPLLAALPAAALIAAGSLQPGLYTNEEQVEFARAKGAPVPPWTGIEVRAEESGLAVHTVDAFGNAGPALTLPITAITEQGLTLRAEDGTPLELLRARRFRCWASMPRAARKPDGSLDWWFKAGLPIHDRGGRLHIETGEPGGPAFTLRMRNVVFPDPPNRPSLVLYVHAEDPVRAVAYSWADPGATRLGINLRTVQASCTLETGSN